MAFDFNSYRVSDSPESKKPALFITADKHSYEVYPCAALFAGKPHAGKSVYLPYAAKRWANREEAFGLVPVDEIRPVCFPLDRGEIIHGIDPINPFEKGNLSCGDFSQFIEGLCECGLCNVIFIDNLRALCSHLKDIPQNLQVFDQQAFIGDFLSKLSARLGVYIFVLHHLSKSKGKGGDIQDAILGTNGIVGSYRGACYITEKADSHIDLFFDWRLKDIRRRVMFTDKPNELIPEPKDSLLERLEEARYEKYGGYELLHELLSQFKDGPVSVRALMASMNKKSSKMMNDLLKKAKGDGYLLKDHPKSSHYLSEKGREVVAFEVSAGCVADLIFSSHRELFNLFIKESLGRDPSSFSLGTEISMSTFSKWKAWLSDTVDPVIRDSYEILLSDPELQDTGIE